MITAEISGLNQQTYVMDTPIETKSLSVISPRKGRTGGRSGEPTGTLYTLSIKITRLPRLA
jgi:hypothetical protein